MKDTLKSVVDTIEHSKTVISDISKNELITYYQSLIQQQQNTYNLWNTIFLLIIGVLAGYIVYNWRNQVRGIAQSAAAKEAKLVAEKEAGIIAEKYLNANQFKDKIKSLSNDFLIGRVGEEVSNQLGLEIEGVRKELETKIEKSKLTEIPEILYLYAEIFSDIEEFDGVRRIALNIIKVQLAIEFNLGWQSVRLALRRIKILFGDTSFKIDGNDGKMLKKRLTEQRELYSNSQLNYKSDADKEFAILIEYSLPAAMGR